MKLTQHILRHGYDGKKCFVHARFCETPDFLIATAQYLDVEGCDLFGGLYSSKSYDGGRSWTEFAPERGLSALKKRMCLVKDTEIALVPERGARLGNFCAYTMSDGRGAVMAAEWMQPKGCEKYGSDNSIFLTFVEE